MKKEKVSAYIRVKDEIKTIESCLNSIDELFDRIIVLYSDEKDDGSIELIHNWAKNRPYAEIYKYPYKVLPSYDKTYNSDYNEKNSLASYNNFGLSFFEPEEYVFKIDADQVYIRPALIEFINGVKSTKANNIKYGLRGYNSFIWNNHLVKYAPTPLNGMGGDSYCIKRKYIEKFIQKKTYEEIVLKDIKKSYIWHRPIWFHFMKQLKLSNGDICQNDNVKLTDIEFLSEEEIEIFEKDIRPLLTTSAYLDVKLNKTNLVN